MNAVTALIEKNGDSLHSANSISVEHDQVLSEYFSDLLDALNRMREIEYGKRGKRTKQTTTNARP